MHKDTGKKGEAKQNYAKIKRFQLNKDFRPCFSLKTLDRERVYEKKMQRCHDISISYCITKRSRYRILYTFIRVSINNVPINNAFFSLIGRFPNCVSLTRIKLIGNFKRACCSKSPSD